MIEKRVIKNKGSRRKKATPRARNPFNLDIGAMVVAGLSAGLAQHFLPATSALLNQKLYLSASDCSANVIEAEYQPLSLSERIAPLKDIEPRIIETPMPDYTTVLTGWRAWRLLAVKNEWRLISLGQRTRWRPRLVQMASCRKSGRPMIGATHHVAPHWDCMCGIWAFKDVERLSTALVTYDDYTVIGPCSLWGRVIETENGYRAEFAYPAELWLLEPHCEDVGRVYGVPVRSLPLPTMDQLIA